MFNVHDWAYSILLYTVSVGFGIAYSVPRAMREPYTRDKQSGRFPRSFYMLPPRLLTILLTLGIRQTLILARHIMLQKHRDYKSLTTECDGEREIRQYMDLDYLIRLLVKKEYYVQQKQEFKDANESRIPFKWLIGLSDYESDYKKGERYREMSIILTSCWTCARKESYLMWKSYTNKMGVCIVSTIQSVVDSFRNNDTFMIDDYNIWTACMDYKSYYYSSQPDDYLHVKSVAYSDENEIRFYFDKKGNRNEDKKEIYVPIDYKTMIKKIILSPFIEPIASRTLADIIQKEYHFNKNQVLTSTIILKQ